MGHVRPGRRAKEERRLRAQEREGVKEQPPRAVTTIAGARSFEELLQVLRQGKGLEGSGGKFYTPSQLVNLVKEARVNSLATGRLTRTAGLRDKVLRLLRSRTVKERKEEFDLRHTITKQQRAAAGLGGY